MSKKKEIKELVGRIEQMEAELRQLRATAEKNAASLSAQIEKLSAAAESPAVKREKTTTVGGTTKEETAGKTTRKRGPRKTAQTNVEAPKEEVPVKQESPAEEKAPAEEKKTRTRTRKPRAADEKQEPAEKSASGRTADRATFVLYNCDEAKTPESMFNKNDETFRDTQQGRRALWNKLKAEIVEGRIQLLDNYPIKNVRLEVSGGAPDSVNKYLKYGFIEKIDK